MRVRTRLRKVWVDVSFLLARLAYGVGAYAFLAVGFGVGVALLLALGLATGLLLHFARPPILGVLLIAFVAGWFLRSVRGRLRRRSLRRAVAPAATSVARGLARACVWWLLAWRAMARRERTRVAAQRGADIPIAYRPLPEGDVPTLRTMITDPATWRDLAYLLLAPAYAAIAALLLGAMWVGAVALVVSPLAAEPTPATWIEPTTWLAVAAGLGALVVAPLVTHAAAGTATGLGAALLSTGESARMRAELDEQRLRRRLAVDAAERERRRIERDLHDGAQQRLVNLGMSLGLAKETLARDPAAAAALIEEAHTDAKLALAELRDLARGIHPAILADRGLDAALSALLRRMHLPISIIVAMARRPSASVESTAYFLVAEALTNVSRHAAATRATVSITEADGLLMVEVVDDGIGGADPGGGTGLAGLADRVTALNGRMTVDSPEGGPTRVRAEIPCAW